ncbi:Uncharacterized protein PECH_003409 [Penicillium ucsense]|uniref:Isopenicillin N synthase-like Fe(2+) 2OG dioxygenase domain-containing protein n=1 Tax=Penicillium ucsense TaxID=2839758 RepID=A0A8J8WDS3_9EURO|nr:Uncharacterized protein PECM_000219 [Penicillium ucsense]KAF7739430.1 Uncharacterized protein PECH_003409 [Penicillium ucsense]
MATATTTSALIVLKGEKPPSTPLEVINFVGFLQKDALELSKLLRSCQDPGSFYLDLSGQTKYFNGKSYLDAIRKIYRQRKAYLSQSADVRDQEKCPATSYTDSSSGSFVSNESSYISDSSFQEDDLVSTLDDETLDFVKEYTHAIAHRLIRTLSPFIGNEKVRQHISSLHADNDLSNSEMTLDELVCSSEEERDESPVGGFVDGSSMTLRYCEEEVLEYWDSETDGWASIAPREDCLVVNVGDVLRAASRDQFQSPLYRVRHAEAGRLRGAKMASRRVCVTHHLWPME